MLLVLLVQLFLLDLILLLLSVLALTFYVHMDAQVVVQLAAVVVAVEPRSFVQVYSCLQLASTLQKLHVDEVVRELKEQSAARPTEG